jgi:hypothetical protein
MQGLMVKQKRKEWEEKLRLEAEEKARQDAAF